ncbi:ATP-binding protein [uncultured Eubacterium sp.]|uniref:ATP-binding protein n=1 Tax=uncultured Eubacterium sp. TaxID=165185 RepID=UPI0015AD6CD2|nr:ATP-binding protein [uncultured Eubacterium sp.]
MYKKSRKKSAILFAGIFVVLGMWMMLSVHCWAAEKNNDEKKSQIIRVGSFEDTFDYVDKNGVRRGYGYELMQALAGYTGWEFEYVKCDWSNCFDKLENGEIDVMPETLEHLEKLQQSGNLLLSIINNVLDMARIESGRMELDENYCRIEDVRKSLFAVFDEKARKKDIALHYTMNVEHEHILTDVTKVKEIFVNILSNAIKYTPAGGSVMMSVDELPCDEPGYMIVRNRVSDTGIGMSQEYMTKIFDAFTREHNTTKSKIAGTGLGMSIVKKYVELLGGTIDVESEPGKGSTFTVTLKHRIADESYYVKRHIEESGTGSEILEGRNILLAEDNDMNAEIAEAILERAGLKIERVENGIQCVNRIMEMPAGTYDMILMDIQMPKMNGYKATQTIRHLPDKDKACIPIIAMTANAFEEDKRDAITAGMNGHIAKPIQVDKLLSMLAVTCKS